VVALVIGAAAVLAYGVRPSRLDQQQIGVLAGIPVVDLKPGHTACEEDIGLADPVQYIGFNARSARPDSPPLSVWVRETTGHRVLGRTRLNPDWRSGAALVQSPLIRSHRFVDVCIRNSGPGRVQLLGDVPGRVVAHVAPDNPLVVDGKPVAADLSIRFVRDRPARLLRLVPAMLRHAAVLRPFGAWGMWVLLLAVVLGLPSLAWLALRGALRTAFD
jgi:hypothetical protein